MVLIKPSLALTIYWESVCFVHVVALLPCRVSMRVTALNLVAFEELPGSAAGQNKGVERMLGRGIPPAISTFGILAFTYVKTTRTV